MWQELRAKQSSSLKSREIPLLSLKLELASWVAGCLKKILRKPSTPGSQAACKVGKERMVDIELLGLQTLLITVIFKERF